MKKIFKYIDKPLLVVTIFLFILGIIMIFSASNVTAYMTQEKSPYNYFIKQGIFLAIGFIASSIILRFSSKTYGKFSYLLMLGGITAQALLPIFAPIRNQARSWYVIGPFTLQPSEFMKIISIVFLAYYYEKNKGKLNTYVKSLFPIAICLISAFLIYIEPDLGTMIIYGSIVACIFLSQPINSKIKMKTIFLGMGVVILALLFLLGTGKGFLLDRQEQRLHLGSPCEKLLTTGNQICNGYIAINNGGLTGVGLGNSTQKYLYLPEPYTDFIFCIIIEELGLLTGLAIIVMYMFILWRILLIGRKSSTDRGATICYGVSIYIFIHIAVNLLGLFGLIPMTGVPLPFMSYGGSFTLCLITALTLVQRISIENSMAKKEGNN